MEVMVGRPNGFTLCVSEKRVSLVVGREKCGGVGKESAESGRVCEQDGGEVEVCVEDGGHVSEESQFPQLRVAAAVVRGEENHVHWRVLGVGCVGRLKHFVDSTHPTNLSLAQFQTDSAAISDPHNDSIRQKQKQG